GVDVFDLTQAEIQGREQIQQVFDFLKEYIPGFEHSFISTTPSKIGVRETRHILGEYLLKLSDISSGKEFLDSIALSGFPIDIHSPNKAVLDLPNITSVKPIQIPLRCLIPLKIEGLIVAGRCISATHEASAAIRVIPTAMAIGEAAGVLAATAINENILPREVPYKLVQSQLKKQNHIY
ncbi:MAG: FAD-dependent oxidoreductase, partial [Tenericutes bacterium]|nr:FAD-dependent oxidoreductase [Mycoplasmatota bacterium]